MPVSLIVTVNEPVPLTTWPVPDTPRTCAFMMKLIVGVGDAVLATVAVPPAPHAVSKNDPASAKTRLRNDDGNGRSPTNPSAR